MRLSLRREPKGRHALGAAVTAIPSAPVRVPVAVPPPVWSPAEREGHPPAPVQALPPPLPSAPVQAVPRVPEPVPAAPEPLALEPVVLPAVSVEPLTVEQVLPAPSPPELPSLPVQPLDLELALLDLVGPLEVAAPPTGPRVELGFADGTFRLLDPASSAAQQLSDLAAELTDKGDGSRSSAS